MNRFDSYVLTTDDVSDKVIWRPLYILIQTPATAEHTLHKQKTIEFDCLLCASPRKKSGATVCCFWAVFSNVSSAIEGERNFNTATLSVMSPQGLKVAFQLIEIETCGSNYGPGV